MAPVARALKDAGLSVSDIDEVILSRRFNSYARIAEEVENSLVSV
jgi:molecular chaperone DnaK